MRIHLECFTIQSYNYRYSQRYSYRYSYRYSTIIVTGIVQYRYSYWIDLRDYTSSTGSGTQYSCSLYGLRSTCVKDMRQCVYSRLHTVEYSRVSLQVQRSAFQFGLRL